MGKRHQSFWAAGLAMMVMGASALGAEPAKPATDAKPGAAGKPAAPAAKPASPATPAVAAAPARATGLRSSWACLPAGDTVFALRVPSGKQMLSTLRAETRFGAVVLSEKRIQQAVDLMKQESAGKWDDMVRDMAKYGLKPEDWSELFVGEAGMAVTMTPVGDKEGDAPAKVQVMVMTWVEPGGDLGKRLLAALQQAAAEDQGKENPAKRVDMEMEGHQVMRLTMAEYRTPPTPAIEPPENFDQLSEAEQKAWWDKQNAEAKKAEGKKVLTGQTHALVTLMGNRLVAGIAPPALGGKGHGGEGHADRAQTQAELAQALEQATSTYARFLAEHKKSGEQGGATGALMATPGAAAAMPAGTTAMEMVLDLRALIAEAQKHAHDPDAAKLLDLSGVKQLGPMAMRVTMDKGAARSGVFVSAPAPRAGLLTLLDQPALASEPTAYTPAEAIGYQHLSFDLGKAYLRIKELAIAGFGQQAEQGFMSAEQSAIGMLQADLPTILSSLGQQHTLVTYAPSMQAGAAPGAVVPQAGGGNKTMTTRTALVWQIKDGELWKRILQAAGMMAAGGPVVWAEEQGFSGWRMKGGGPGAAPGMPEGGLFTGKNFLALAIGPQVCETTLNTLGKPPEGKAAMRGSDLYQRAKALMPLKPSQVFHINDANRTMPLMREVFIAGIEQMASGAHGLDMDMMDGGAGEQDNADVDEEANRGGREAAPRPMQAHDHAGHGHAAQGPRIPADKIKALVPTEKELDGVLGVSVGQLVVTPQGITYQSAVEMPPNK